MTHADGRWRSRHRSPATIPLPVEGAMRLSQSTICDFGHANTRPAGNSSPNMRPIVPRSRPFSPSKYRDQFGLCAFESSPDQVHGCRRKIAADVARHLSDRSQRFL